MAERFLNLSNYNPTAGTYLLKFTDLNAASLYEVALDDTTLDTANSTGSDTRFAKTFHWNAGDTDLAVTASLTNLGDDNTEIELRYTQILTAFVDNLNFLASRKSTTRTRSRWACRRSICLKPAVRHTRRSRAVTGPPDQ